MNIKQWLFAIISECLALEDVSFDVLVPESTFGDYSTNIAMVLAKKEKKNPRELASDFALKISNALAHNAEKVEVAGAGFVNITLSKDFYQKRMSAMYDAKCVVEKVVNLDNKKILVEYTDPNPFKPFHIGHLMTNAIGESVSRILQSAGAIVSRANYQGDVGLHVAKAIYGIMQRESIPYDMHYTSAALYIGACYVDGAQKYEEGAKVDIDAINKKIYQKSDEEINKIYSWGREVTLKAFEDIYKILGTKFDYYFFESEMAQKGVEIVKNHPDIFSLSEGAIVYKGEDKGLHTRVFVTSAGLPTYEAKELALAFAKFSKDIFDLSITVTANEQGGYMKVVTESIKDIDAGIGNKMLHLPHGMMKFANGGKMSSRKGNIITGDEMMKQCYDLVYERIGDRVSAEKREDTAWKISIAAIKYSILKPALGGDISFDFSKSISFDGDSGPYLQYSAVRAGSVIKKAVENKIHVSKINAEAVSGFEKLLSRFDEVVALSAVSKEPHVLVTYLTELASEFNKYYTSSIIIQEGVTESYRLLLVNNFYNTITNGLWMLGIEVPEAM